MWNGSVIAKHPGGHPVSHSLPPNTRLRRLSPPIAIFLLVFVGHALSPITTSFDSRWTIYIAESVIHQGNTDLDEYPQALAENQWYAIERVGGHSYSLFPVGPALVAVPFVLALDKTLPYALADSSWVRQRLQVTAGPPYDAATVDALALKYHAHVEKVAASLLVALTAVLVYLIAALFVNAPLALVATVIFAFGGSSWSSASRALWQHAPTMLLLATALYLLLLARTKPRLAQFAALPLALSYVMRPTNALSILALSLVVLVRYRQYFLRYVLWALPVVILFVAYNESVYHDVLSPYYRHGYLPGTRFWLNIAGNLVSPARGLFVFSPVFLFSIVGVAWKIRERRMEILDWSLFAVIILHLVATSSFSECLRGHFYGPRYWADMLPYLTYFLIPALAAIPAMKPGRRAWLVSGVAATALVSVFINYRGAATWDVYRWLVDPIDIDVKTSRVWDWHDPQFLRGLGHAPSEPGMERPGGTLVLDAAGTRLQHQWGTATPDASASSRTAWMGEAAEKTRGALVFGPYVLLPAGDYEATFRIKAIRRYGDPQITLDVFCRSNWRGASVNTYLAREELAPSPVSNGYEEHTIRFSVPDALDGARVETRVWSTQPGAEIWLDQVQIRRLR